MARGDIRFSGSQLEVNHRSARGKVRRNSSTFTRGSQLLVHEYLMTFSGIKIPFLIWLSTFVIFTVVMLLLIMNQGEVQLVLMRGAARTRRGGALKLRRPIARQPAVIKTALGLLKARNAQSATALSNQRISKAVPGLPGQAGINEEGAGVMASLDFTVNDETIDEAGRAELADTATQSADIDICQRVLARVCGDEEAQRFAALVGGVTRGLEIRLEFGL